jgi:hypothetical protein
LIELGYSDPAWYVGSEAAYYAGVSLHEIQAAWCKANREYIRATPDGDWTCRYSDETEADFRARGWAALLVAHPELARVRPWSRAQIDRYAARIERACENRAVADFEDRAYGRD